MESGKRPSDSERRLLLLLAALVLLAVLPWGAVSYVVYGQVRSVLLNQTSLRLNSLAADREQVTRLLIEKQQDVLRLLARDEAVIRLAGALRSDPPSRHPSETEQLERILARNSFFEGLLVADMTGSRYQTAGKFPVNLLARLMQEQEQEQEHKARSVHLAVTPSGERMFVIGQFIREGAVGSAPIGQVLAHVQFGAFESVYADVSALGTTGESFLADRNGRPLTPLRYLSGERAAHPITAGPMRDCLQGRSDVSAIDPGYEGVLTVMAYRPVKLFGGCVMVHMRASEVYAPLLALRNQLAVIVGATLALVLLTGLLVARRVLEIEEARKRAEAAQVKSARQFLLLLESTNEGLYGLDLNGCCTFINRAGAQMLGYRPDELIGKNMHVLIHHTRTDGTPYPAADCPLFRAFRTGQGYEYDGERLWRRDGRSFLAAGSSFPIIEAGQVTGAVVAFSDVSEHRQVEERLRQVQKIETVGRLAGGIAHYFNNLMTVVTGYCGVILDRIDADDQHRPKIEAIKRAGDRAAVLTKQLLAFSRKQTMVPIVLDLNRVVEETGSLLRPLVGAGHRLMVKLSPAPAWAKVDPEQIQYILVGLTLNACEAMPQGGLVVIQTDVTEFETPVSHRNSAVPVGRYVMLAVSDTGRGMDENTLAHVFEPFFTTKEQGEGVGLSLAAAYGIVRQSGGYILADSEPGKGSSFTMYFPLVTPAASVSPSPADL
jgi:PAS domain S-box-containing protein